MHLDPKNRAEELPGGQQGAEEHQPQGAVVEEVVPAAVGGLLQHKVHLGGQPPPPSRERRYPAQSSPALPSRATPKPSKRPSPGEGPNMPRRKQRQHGPALPDQKAQKGFRQKGLPEAPGKGAQKPLGPGEDQQKQLPGRAALPGPKEEQPPTKGPPPRPPLRRGCRSSWRRPWCPPCRRGSSVRRSRGGNMPASPRGTTSISKSSPPPGGRETCTWLVLRAPSAVTAEDWYRASPSKKSSSSRFSTSNTRKAWSSRAGRVRARWQYSPGPGPAGPGACQKASRRPGRPPPRRSSHSTMGMAPWVPETRLKNSQRPTSSRTNSPTKARVFHFFTAAPPLSPTTVAKGRPSGQAEAPLFCGKRSN